MRQSGRSQRKSHIVIGDDERAFANPETIHDLGKLRWLSQHIRDSLFRVGELIFHAYEDGARDMTFEIAFVIIGADAATLFEARAPTRIDNSDIGIA